MTTRNQNNNTLSIKSRNIGSANREFARSSSKALIASLLASISTLGFVAFVACSSSDPKRLDSSSSAGPKGAKAGQVIIEEVDEPKLTKSGQDIASAAPTLDQYDDGGIGLAHIEAKPVDHLGRALRFEEAGDRESALLELRRGMYDSECATCLERMAPLAKQTRKHELVFKSLARLAELRPDDPKPLLQLARYQLERKDFAGALKSAKRAISRDPENADCHHLSGRAHLQMKNLSEAINSFSKAVELNPSHAYAQNNLGYSLLLAGENDDAIEALEKAAKLIPEVAFVHNSLGLAYERAGRRDEAKAEYAMAIELRPRYVKAKVNAARAEKYAQNESIQSDAIGADIMPDTAEPSSDFIDSKDTIAMPPMNLADDNLPVDKE